MKSNVFSNSLTLFLCLSCTVALVHFFVIQIVYLHPHLLNLVGLVGLQIQIHIFVHHSNQYCLFALLLWLF